MLTVEHWELIRRKHFIEGLTQRAIARELGHSRDTVSKALKHPVPPGYRQSQPRAKPALEPVKPIIDAWLEQDRHRPRKQRHKARRIYERLCEEHPEKLKASESTVRRYVSEAKAQQGEVFMPLAFEPGEEAQVDWHEGWVVENGEWAKVQFFCMRLCYSKATFVWPYRRATLEAFLDGHVRAFEYFGGIPRRLAYDNLKSAVIQIKHGKERRLNKRFKELVSWYVFETRFCNLAAGHEKGDVENLAKRSERTYLTPPPEVADLWELSSHLEQCCDRDLDRAGPAPHQAKTRREMLNEEQAAMRSLPEHRFEACQRVGTFVGKHALVQYQANFYSAPVRYAHQTCTVKAFVDRIEIVVGDAVVARHPRREERGQYELIPEHYLPLLEKKPGALDNARPFKGMFRGQPWGEDFALLRRELEYRHEEDGTWQYIRVLLLFTEHDEADVKEAVRRCVQQRAFAYEAVVTALNEEPVRVVGRLDLTDRPELAITTTGQRSTALYDQLLDERKEVPA